jgi:4'-phosphopantetheinyl transferase
MAAGLEFSLKFTLRPFDPKNYRNMERSLTPQEVHVWSLAVDNNELDLSEMRDVLSVDERERAGRFRFEPHRAQYVRTRATLRWLLAHYLGVPADEIWLGYSSYGKPTLVEPASHDLEFNVSHTEGIAIFGFTRGHRIGVDIEKLRTDFEAEEIAERFFSPAERAALHAIAKEARHAAFFRVWTRKESYIKALGEGLSHPLHQFDVSAGDDDAWLIATRPQASEAQRWHLEDLKVVPGYVAAVAVETCPPPHPIECVHE